MTVGQVGRFSDLTTVGSAAAIMRVVAMGSWMQRVAAWARARRGRKRPYVARRSAGAGVGGLRVEALERREVLSAAAVTPFFSVSGQIAAAGQAATVDFRLASGTLSTPRGGATILLGLAPRPTAGAALTPTVTMLAGRGGAMSVPAIGSKGAPFLARVSAPAGADAPYTATVRGLPGESGGFEVDGFLPGDVNGDLRVDKADLDRVLAAYGSREGDPRYDAAADINQDGRVGCRDKYYATQNLGAKFTAAVPVAAVAASAATPAVSAPVPAIPPAQAPKAAVAVAPVVATLAVPPVVVATQPAPIRPANLAWIPVLATGDGSSAPAAAIGGAMWSPQSSVYYPSVAPGTSPYAASAASFAPAAPIYFATPPAGYATPGSAVPAGPYYYALPASGIPGSPATQPGLAPVYLGTAVG